MYDAECRDTIHRLSSPAPCIPHLSAMNAAQLRAHRRDNHLQSIVLILGIALIMGVVGYVLGGRWGVWFALVFSLASAVVSPAISPRMILRMYQARPLEDRKSTRLNSSHLGI